MSNLAKIRASKGLTLEELGSKVGLSRQRICMLENSKLKPANAKKCAEALGENVFDVLGLDSLALLPKTKADKKALLKIINDIEVE